MQPREREENFQYDLFLSRLDQIINVDHELVKLSEAMD